jgi:outer membrane cobalamin receptor
MRLFCLFLLILSANISFCFAKSTSDENPIRILITPNRFDIKVNQTSSNVIVLDRKDIENSSSNTLSEILNSIPGVSSGNQGGIGQTASYFLQGFEKKYISILRAFLWATLCCVRRATEKLGNSNG